MSKIDTLAAELKAASAAYYGGGTPIMSDVAFDTMEAELRRLDPLHPVLSQIGSPVGNTGWPKVNHPRVMGSLDKAQTLEDFAGWRVGKSGDLVVTEKLDGISVLLTYDDGLLVRAATRGDGHVGEDITRNVRVMKGVPAFLLGHPRGTTLVRAEIVCTKADFAAYFQGESNPRNTAGGTAKRQSGWQKCRHLTVIAYNFQGENLFPSRSRELETLENYGFKTPWWVGGCRASRVESAYEGYLAGDREKAAYDIDGLVVEIDDTEAREALGTTPDGKCPRGAIALKFPHDMAGTFLRALVWQTGPTGRITPVAEFDAVTLAGANVSRASLHNPGYIASLAKDRGLLRAGDQIRVSRRNDVIPAVELVLWPSPDGAIVSDLPEKCPSCGCATSRSGAYLVCTNEDECPAQVLGTVRRWISKVGVLHFGDAMVEAVVEAGLVNSLGDLYRLEEADVAALEMDGRRIGGAATRALESLNSKKELDLDTFVGSLGINLCGRRMVGMLVEGGFDTLSKLASASEGQLAVVPGFGTKRAQEFEAGFEARKHQMVDLLAAGVTVKAPAAPVAAPSTSGLAGSSFCFTGVRDAALEAEIQKKGGVVKSGVSRGLKYLVCKDPRSKSTKMEKAQDLGVMVVSLEDARSLVAGA